MQFIQGQHRQQNYFATLEDQVAPDTIKKGEANETSYRFKTYRTGDCKICPLKNQCTKIPKRTIHRSEYQNAVNMNDNNIKQNPHYYKRRQAIVEHPFGTIKRHFGFTHTLLKGLQKVNGELSEANHDHKK